jgi:hypothetical protein
MKLIRAFEIGMAVLIFSCTRTMAFIPAMTFDPELAEKADKQFDRTTFDKLRKLKVSVNWDVSPGLALKDLESKAQKADLPPSSIRFTIDLTQGDQKLVKEVPAKVQILISDVDVWTVLQYFSQQTNLIPLIHKDHVIMVPGKESRVSFPKDFHQPANVR